MTKPSLHLATKLTCHLARTIGRHGAMGRWIDFYEKQRDTYRYIHDQTLRLANHGGTMVEIAEQIKLPSSLAKEFYNRGYYGTLNFNSKAQYQYYYGWFDGNPAHLNPLPPTKEAIEMVRYMGGAEAILEKSAA